MAHWFFAFAIAFVILVVAPACKAHEKKRPMSKDEAYKRGKERAREHRRLSDAYERGYADGCDE